MLHALFQAGCRALAAGDPREAARIFREALAQAPQVPEFWNNLGISLFDGGERREAVEVFRRAVELSPRFAEALNNLGRALAVCGQPEEGLAACREALAIEPGFAGALENAGVILMECGRHKEALAYFDRACAAAPGSPSAWNNKGAALKELGRLGGAASCFRRVLALAPGRMEGRVGLASLHLLRGEVERYIALLRQCIALDPENAQIHSDLLLVLNYSEHCSQADLAAESRLWGALHGVSPLSGPREPREFLGRRLRIGYLSADLRRHPVGFFLKEVLKHHDRCSFEITCYHSGTRSDQITEELRRNSERWFVIAGMSDAEAHSLIVANGIDILVDLSGHTGGNRLRLFAGRPAPVQASWIGYSASTGLPAMDYLISDAVSAPVGEEGYYTERLIRLPHCRFCYAPPAPAPFVDELPATANGFVTFGSFNNLAKLTPPVIALWARLLLAVPGSRLVLKWKSLDAYAVRRRIQTLFARHGVDPQRIECRGFSNHYLALAEYNDVDVALDPFPFTGGLTSCEALWMGVPVLTLLGATPIGRQTASFLEAIGLPELIARDEDEFLALALALAGDLPRLAALREGLRDRMAGSPLCDGARFAGDLEQGYRTMLQQSPGPTPLVVPPRAEAGAPSCCGAAPAAGPAYAGGTVVLFPPDQLRVAYLAPGLGAPELSELLQTIALHDREALAPFLYFTGELPEQAGAAALLRGVRLRPVGALTAELIAQLVHRDRIDLLVDLAAYGDSPRSAPQPYAVAVSLESHELPAPEPEPELRRASQAARLEAFYWERWLGWFVAQRKPRRGGKASPTGALAALVQQGVNNRRVGCLEEAEAQLVQAVLLDPRSADAVKNLGTVYVYRARLAQGLAMFRRALLLDPADLKAHSNLLFAMNYQGSYDCREAYAESLAWEKAHARFPSQPHRSGLRPADPGRSLRIGYLSADFYQHAVSTFFEPLLAHHDRERFETVCYSFVERPDQTTDRLKSLASVWRDCALLGDGEVAQLVREDRIDILVDLAGHTGARILLPILARRPAPIQVSWLGYPNTTGLSAIDYRLTDPLVDPESEGNRYYSERLVRLAGGFLCYLPPADAPEPAPAPSAESGTVTFGSFNMLPKLSEATIALWSRIMLRVPDAKLVLKSHPLADQRTRVRVLSAFARYGVGEQRITLLGQLPSACEHLASYGAIDLALDSFPYNGTTTTCEALWMGVPVLALDGDRHAGRVSGSLLRRLGHGELVAANEQDYLERAVALAADPQRLAGYRATLRPSMAASPLCDGAQFAAQVEAAYREMRPSPKGGSRLRKNEVLGEKHHG